MKEISAVFRSELGENEFVKKCARCEGTGRGYYSSGSHSTEPCKVCNGRGFVLIKITGRIPFVKCSRCEGTGRGYYSSGARSTEPCKACKGVGEQPITGSLEIIR